MFDSDKSLSTSCLAIADAARDALRWVECSEKKAIRDDGHLIKALRKRIVEAGKLHKAATRKMCAGVFGASQAGKSYLISTLARKDGQPLMALFGTTQVDFIAEINPEGGKESTGLVTRFTVDRDINAPADHPVRVGLLSESDVIKVLANSYTFDIMHPDDDDEDAHAKAILATLDALRAKVGRSGTMSVESVYDLEDYCNKRLLKTARMRALQKTRFWDDAAEIGPVLSQEDRVALFSLLWAENPVYTDIYRRLLGALTLLGHPDEAYCAPDCLVDTSSGVWRRHDASIINVSTLNGIGEDSETSNDRVSIMAPGGKPIRLPRAEVTALVAEMIIVMKDEPYPFFGHTDLLDFPGARTRKREPAESLERPENRTENILRGKVAYLFDRYCDEQELTSMLLCVGPSNQDVADLPGMVEDWIIGTHGKTPEDRAKAETALFFILTKFDTAFEQGAGKGVDGSRWETRLQASLISPFADRAHRTNWVKAWTPDTPFTNLFWVRNPNYRQDSLFDYESSSSLTEVSIRADKKDFVETLRQACITQSVIQTYFPNPVEAWEAGMTLNDGGMTRIAEALGPVCRPDTKRLQTGQRLKRLSDDLHNSLKPFYISGDLDTLRAEKVDFASKATRMLAGAFNKQKLGEILYTLRMDEKDSHSLFSTSERVAARTAVGTEANTGIVTTYEKGDDVLSLLGLTEDPAPATASSPAADPPKTVQDLAEKFVSDLEMAWSAHVADVVENDALANYLCLDKQVTLRLADELRIAAHRLGVFDRMVAAVRKGQQLKTNREAWVWRQVSPACAIFNAFVAHLCLGGVDRPEGSVITDIANSEVRIFQPRPPINDIPDIQEQVEPYERDYFLDWIRGMQHSIISNAAFQAGFTGNAEENATLGDILLRLSSAA